MPTLLYDEFGRSVNLPTSEDLEEAARKSRIRVEEHTRATIDSLTQIQKKMEEINKAQGESWKRKEIEDAYKTAAFSATMTMKQALGDAMTRSIPATLQKSMANAGFGKYGEEFGQVAGMAIGTALTGSPLIGKMVGAITSLTIKGLNYVIEGRQMMGAQYAPQITGGRGIPAGFNFAEEGGKLTTTLNKISFATGATEEQALGLMDKQSKVGIAFKGAGVEAVRYGAILDRVMNLNVGTAQSLQIDAFAKYGEGLGASIKLLHDVREGQKGFVVMSMATNNSILRSISSGQTYISMIGQIASAASNSNASLTGMASAAHSLMLTMSMQGIRPELQTQIAGGALKSLLPQATANMAEEAKRSTWMREDLAKTPVGRHVKRVIDKLAPPWLQGKDAEQTFNTSALMALGKRKGLTNELFMSHVARIDQLRRESPTNFAALTEAYGQKYGLSTPQTRAIAELGDYIRTKMHLDPGTNRVNILKRIRDMAKTNPDLKVLYDKAGFNKKDADTAREQAQAMKSAMDNLARVNLNLLNWFGSYWDEYDKRISKQYGLGKNAKWWEVGAADALHHPAQVAMTATNPIQAAIDLGVRAAMNAVDWKALTWKAAETAAHMVESLPGQSPPPTGRETQRKEKDDADAGGGVKDEGR